VLGDADLGERIGARGREAEAVGLWLEIGCVADCSHLDRRLRTVEERREHLRAVSALLDLGR
jgi:hypothetical protein